MMLKYLYDRDKLVSDFVARMIPYIGECGFGNCRAIGVVDERNELIAGIVYHKLVPYFGVMEISVAALPKTRWVTPTTLAVAYEFPFLRCDCQLVIHTTKASNTSVQRQLAAIGCMHSRLPRLFGREEDAVICSLTYEQWAGSAMLQRFRRAARQQGKAA